MNLNELYMNDTQNLCSIRIALGSFSEWFQKRYDQFLEFLSSNEDIQISVPFVSQAADGNIINKTVVLSKNQFDTLMDRDDGSDIYRYEIPCADGSVLETDAVTVDTLVDAVFDCGKSAAINSGLFQYLSTIGTLEKVNITDLISTIKTKINIPDNDVSIAELTAMISGSGMTKDAFLSAYLQSTKDSFNPEEFIFDVNQYDDFSLVKGIFLSVSLDIFNLTLNIVQNFKTIVNGLKSIVSAIKDGFEWIMNRINPGLMQDYEVSDVNDGGIIDIPIYHTVLPIDSNVSLLFINSYDWYTWSTTGMNYHYRVPFGSSYTYRELFNGLINSSTKYIEIIRSFHIIRLIYLPDDQFVDVQIYLTNQGCDQFGQYYSLLPSNNSNEAVMQWIYNLLDKVEHQIYKYPCSPEPVPTGVIPDPYWVAKGSSHLFYLGQHFTVDANSNKPIDLISDLTFISNQNFINNPYGNTLASSLLRYVIFQYLLSTEKDQTLGSLYVDQSQYETTLIGTDGISDRDCFFPYNRVPNVPVVCHCQTNMEVTNEWKTFFYKAIVTTAIVTSAIIVTKMINRIKRNSYLKKVIANEKANAYARGEISYDELVPYLKKARKYQKLSDVFAPATSLIGVNKDNETYTQILRDIKSVGVLIMPTF